MPVTKSREWVLPVAICMAMSLAIAAPRVFLDYDMWDGVRSQYAADTMNWHWLVTYFESMSSWKFHGVFIAGQIYLSVFTGISFLALDFVFLTISLTIMFLTCFFLAFKFFLKTAQASWLCVILLGVFPVWNVSLSSISTYMICMIAIGLTGVILILTSNQILWVLGFSLIFVSFSLNSLLVFLPLLVYGTDISRRKSRPSPKTLTVFLLAVIFYGLNNIVSPMRSESEVDINRPLSPFMSASYSEYLSSLVSFIRFWAPFFFILLIVVIVKELTRYIGRNKAVKSESSLVFNVSRIASTLPGLIGSVIPYVVVGKNPNLFELDWSSRHGLLFAIGSSFFLSAIVMNLKSKQVRVLILTVTISFYTFVSLLQYSAKINRQNFEEVLAVAIKSQVNSVPRGLISIYGPNLPVPAWSDYEATYWWYNITGQNDSLVYVRDTRPFASTNHYLQALRSNPDYQDDLAFRNFFAVCVTEIEVFAEGFGPTNDGSRYSKQMLDLIISFFEPDFLSIRLEAPKCGLDLAGKAPS